MKLYKIKIGAKVILTVNVDTLNHLINGQTRNIWHIEFNQGSVRKKYVKCSGGQADLRPIKSSYLGGRKFWVTIEKCETEISIKKGLASPSIKRAQFPLTKGIYCS